MPGGETVTGPAVHVTRDDPRYKALIRSFRAECEQASTPCWLCRQPIDYRLRHRPGRPIPDGAFEADHYKTWSEYPHLRMDRANLRATHHSCNRRRSNKPADESRAVLALGEPSRDW